LQLKGIYIYIYSDVRQIHQPKWIIMNKYTHGIIVVGPK
jgi:hypothetical protein